MTGRNIYACIMCLAVLSSLLNLTRWGTSGAGETSPGVDPAVVIFLFDEVNTKEANWFKTKLGPL